jgi:hypothetical protein
VHEKKGTSDEDNTLDFCFINADMLKINFCNNPEIIDVRNKHLDTNFSHDITQKFTHKLCGQQALRFNHRSSHSIQQRYVTIHVDGLKVFRILSALAHDEVFLF